MAAVQMWMKGGCRYNSPASGCTTGVEKRERERKKERMKIWQLIAKDNVESLRLKATKKITTNAQLIEMFCSKTCSRSFSDSLSIEFKNNVTEEGEKKRKR